MLYSNEASTNGEKRPHFSLWFGNFFEPYYSDKKLVEKGMKEIADMGFNSIILDSKLWEDFTDFFQTGEQSDYVSMQLFMIEQCRKNGLGANFLTLFYNGDNLYPHIRESAPDILNPVTGMDGKPFRGYRHWDSRQTQAMINHTVNLYEKMAKDTAAKATDEHGQPKIPCYFYHSPAVMPSYDEEGTTVYIQFLKTLYTNITDLNSSYEMQYVDFDEILLKSVWPLMTAEDYQVGGVRMLMHRDNMLFRQYIMEQFYAELTKGIRERIPDIYLYDCVSQWKYLLPDWVEISERGLDIWTLGKYLDCPSFYTLPADAYGEPNAYSVSCEMAILRSACRHKHLTGGLFLGRYLFGDIYASATPAEMLASSFGSGATDMFFYGYSGLDDGGNFAKWSADRKLSVKNGLDWFAAVRETAGERIDLRQAAILFPQASFTMDNRNLNDANFRACRNDSLGYYQQLADLGINADFLSAEQASSDILSDYPLLVLPSNPFYSWLRNPKLEESLIAYVQNGGTIIASASCGLFDVFSIVTESHAEDSILWDEKITDFSRWFVSFKDVQPLALYGKDGAIAMALKEVGKGKIYMSGFDMGACYCEKKHKPVPVAYGREDHYPLAVISQTPVEKWVKELGLSDNCHRGIERIPFDNGTLIINHTSYDYLVEPNREFISTFASFDGRLLPGHHSVFLYN